MKNLKKFLQYIFIAIGIEAVLLCLYVATINAQTTDKFVTIVTAVLSAICSLWICGDIKMNNNSGK